MTEDYCLCSSCRRLEFPAEIQWVGTCSCQGQDFNCFNDPDNYLVFCPECRAVCSAETSPSLDGEGWGHITWKCDWLPCGWWW